MRALLSADNQRSIILWIAALAVLLGGFGLRMWRLNAEPVWHDEGWSIRAIQGPFTTPDDNTPYGYYTAGHLLWRAAGSEDGAAPLVYRYVSVLFGALTVAAGLRVGLGWLGRSAGLTAGLLVAVSPLLWDYAQEVRAYVVVPLVALGLLYAADRLLHLPPDAGPRRAVLRRDWLLLMVIALAGLYTHNLTVPLLAWLNAALFGAWLWRRDWSRIVTLIAVMGATGMAYLPWLLSQSPSGTPLNTRPVPGLDLARDIWASYFLPVLAQLQDARAGLVDGLNLAPVLDAAGALLAALILLIIARNIPLRNRPAPSPTARPEGEFPALSGKTGAIRLWLLVSYTLLVPAFSMALLIAASIDFHPRYTIAAVPGTLLLIAAAGRLLPRPVNRMALAAIAVSGLAISAASLNQIATTRAYQHDDFAALADYYASLPPSAVILVPYNLEPALQVYYAARMDIQAQFVNIPLYAEEDAVLAALRELDGQRQIEFLTWFQLPADPRGMYPCLLTAAWAGEPSDPRTFYGLATQSFTRGGVPTATDATFNPLPLAPTYDEVALLEAGYVASDYGICVRTRWALNQPLADLTAAVALRDPLGGIIDRDDAAAATAENVGAGDWSANESGAAYALLTLPTGAPADDYGLSLTAYTSAQPTGFDVVDAAGNPAGRALTVPNAITAAGPPFPPGAEPQQPALAASSVEPGGTLETGRPLALTLLLPRGNLRDVPVTLAGAGWDVTETLAGITGPQLDWLALTVPPGSSGDATLTVDGVEVAQFTVVDVDRTFDAPAFDTPVNVAFPDVGTLAGVSVPETVSVQQPFAVTLVWQAEGATDIPYTVFVQLLTPDGINLAQSDAGPAADDRPTTGWVAGEYVVDTHTLRWNVSDYRGPAVLIAGFYDAAGGFQRVNTADGDDHAVIPVDVAVGD